MAGWHEDLIIGIRRVAMTAQGYEIYSRFGFTHKFPIVLTVNLELSWT